MNDPQRKPGEEWKEFKNKEPLARSHKPEDAEIGDEAIFPPEPLDEPGEEAERKSAAGSVGPDDD